MGIEAKLPVGGGQRTGGGTGFRQTRKLACDANDRVSLQFATNRQRHGAFR